LFRGLLLCSVLALLFPAPVYPQQGPVDRIMELMTVEQRIGQLFMVDFVGTDTGDESGISQLILEYKVGAVLISESTGNIINQGEEPLARQVSRLTNELQSLAYQANGQVIEGDGTFVPLFIALEQEGNGFPHTQLRSGFTPVLSNMALGASWSDDQARATGAIVGQELASLGVNMLLGPVVDVLESPRSGGRGDLGVRTFGGNPYWVGRLARSYVRGVHEGSEGRVATIAKHFPGRGSSGRDPESEVATVDKTLEEMRAGELVPFAALTAYAAGDPLSTTDGLMVGHIRCQAFQQGMRFFSDPLTLDEGGLRVAMDLPEFSDWHSTGLLVADFLGADSIKEHRDPWGTGFPHFRIAQQALVAGNDILPLVQFSVSDDWTADAFPKIVATIERFQERYETDGTFRPWVDQAVRKILQAKLRLYGEPSLERVLVDEDAAASSVGGGVDAVRQMAEEAVTLLYPSVEELGSRLASPPTPDDDIVILQCFEDCYPTPVLSGEALQNTLVRLYGPEGTGQVNPERVRSLGFGQVYDWIGGNLSPADAGLVERLMQDAEWVILALSDYNPDDFPASRAAKALLEEREYYLSGKQVVAIAYDAPYHLDSTEVGKLSAYYAVYGRAIPSLEASWRPIFEPDFVPLGASPVDVAGADYWLASELQPAPGETIELERLSPPADAPLHVGGEPLVVQTSMILDRNGHAIPDGTYVEFRGSYLRADIFLGPQVVTDTVGGVAGASFWLDAPAPGGFIEVTAMSGEATSDALRVEVLVPVTPFPTFTPTATAMPSPTPTLTPAPTRPAPVIPTPAPPPVPPAVPATRPVDWLDLVLAGLGTVLGSLAGSQVRRGHRKGWEREVQIILYGVALALIGYVLYGLGPLNPMSVLGWQGAGVRTYLLLLSMLLAFLPGSIVWMRGP